jgi:hypothetical protein
VCRGCLACSRNEANDLKHCALYQIPGPCSSTESRVDVDIDKTWQLLRCSPGSALDILPAPSYAVGGSGGNPAFVATSRHCDKATRRQDPNGRMGERARGRSLSVGEESFPRPLCRRWESPPTGIPMLFSLNGARGTENGALDTDPQASGLCHLIREGRLTESPLPRCSCPRTKH